MKTTTTIFHLKHSKSLSNLIEAKEPHNDALGEGPPSKNTKEASYICYVQIYKKLIYFHSEYIKLMKSGIKYMYMSQKIYITNKCF